MKSIKISDEVWDAIAAKGKFGETEDVVLRRVFGLDDHGGSPSSLTSLSPNGPSSTLGGSGYSWKQRRATDRMTQTVTTDGRLVLAFDSGPKQEWKLPGKDDSRGIRRVRDEAVAFVKSNGGTVGQEHAAIRALTSRGYHVTVKRDLEEFC